MKRLFSNTEMIQGFFSIHFIDGLSKTQHGEETSTYENIIKSIDTTFGELVTGAAVGFIALSLAGAALPYIFGGFILVAFLASGSNGYYGLG